MRTLLTALAVMSLFIGCKKDEAPAVKAPPPPAAAAVAPAPVEGPRVITMDVTGDGFVPANVTVKAGEPVKLVVTRRTDETCATELLIEGTEINAPLPLGQAVEVAWTPEKAGKVKFGCAMDKMIGGLLLVE